MYKVGDRVRVKEHLVDGQYYGGVYFADDMERYIRKVFKIENIFNEDDVKCYVLDDAGSWHWSDSMFEKVEESIEMTFPEMVQKLIDGEFEVGTGLIATDKNGKNKRYEAVRNLCGYGINTEESITPNYINGSWIVEEQPIKEMSIEELQKELGYKIKIVE